MDDGPTRLTFERLFDEMGVDLVLEAHEHSYASAPHSLHVSGCPHPSDH